MKSKTRLRHGLENGYRSGLEDKNGAELTARSIPYLYEDWKIKYLKPAQYSTYKPDFTLLNNGIIVETKGRFTTADRKKHLLIKEQHPELDIRFVFQNSNNRISKYSKTTYALWCERNGFLYADKMIPLEWCQEPERPYLQKLLAIIKGGQTYDPKGTNLKSSKDR